MLIFFNRRNQTCFPVLHVVLTASSCGQCSLRIQVGCDIDLGFLSRTGRLRYGQLSFGATVTITVIRYSIGGLFERVGDQPHLPWSGPVFLSQLASFLILRLLNTAWLIRNVGRRLMSGPLSTHLSAVASSPATLQHGHAMTLTTKKLHVTKPRSTGPIRSGARTRLGRWKTGVGQPELRY